MSRPFFREIGQRPEDVERVRDACRGVTSYWWRGVEVGSITDSQMVTATDVTIDWNAVRASIPAARRA